METLGAESTLLDHVSPPSFEEGERIDYSSEGLKWCDTSYHRERKLRHGNINIITQI